MQVEYAGGVGPRIPIRDMEVGQVGVCVCDHLPPIILLRTATHLVNLNNPLVTWAKPPPGDVDLFPVGAELLIICDKPIHVWRDPMLMRAQEE